MPLLDIIGKEDNAVPLSELIALTIKVSRSEAQRLLKQRAIILWAIQGPDIEMKKYFWVDKTVVTDPKARLRCTEDDLWGIKIGKRRMFWFSQVIGEVLISELNK